MLAAVLSVEGKGMLYYEDFSISNFICFGIFESKEYSKIIK